MPYAILRINEHVVSYVTIHNSVQTRHVGSYLKLRTPRLSRYIEAKHKQISLVTGAETQICVRRGSSDRSYGNRCCYQILLRCLHQTCECVGPILYQIAIAIRIQHHQATLIES